MTTPKLQCEAVKNAISSGNATASTVTTLQSLLSSEAKSTAATTKTTTTQLKKTAATKKTTAIKTTGAKSSRNGEPIGVHQDDVRSLTPKERYTLATEIVNITLKHLTESLKSRTKQQSSSNSTADGQQTVPTTPRKLSRTPSSTSRSALQPRSGNSTPVAATPSKPKSSPKPAAKDTATSPPGPSAHITAVGECSRLGFSFLRSANTKQLGVKDLPAFQLENGMLALSGKLLAHGLDSSAIKELRIVKGRLEAVGKAKTSSSQEKETLATLLHVKIDVTKCHAILPLVITYQSLVLRVIASSSKPATIEACAAFLELSEATSPANLIKIHGEQSGDKDKTARLLEALSSTVLALCPSLSSKADQLANNREISPAPEAVLRLQSIGLQIRQQWWALVQHQPNLEKELLDPASRCISAFVRRTRKRRSIQQVYAAASQFFQDTVPDCESSDSKALLAMRRTLSSLAEETGQSSEVQKWSAALDKQSEGLEPNHAHRISALVRRMSTLDSDAASLALPELINSLKDTVSGSPSDYECLLDDLSHLLTKLPADYSKEDDLQQLGSLSAAFALRFVRSYPGKGLCATQTVIHQALRHSVSSDAVISWIDNDAIQVLVDTGALQTVSQEAASRPLYEAWSSSTAAITLGRALRLLVVRALKASSGTNSGAVFDDENLSNLERGVMLQWQLNAAMEHATKSRYHTALRILIPQLLHKLDRVYSSSEHPLRRANLAVQVLRVNEEISNVVPRQAMEIWNETQLDTAKLFQDNGLGSYADDVILALRLAKIFHAGHLSFQNVGPLLSAWQRLLDEVTKPSMLKDRVFDLGALRLSLRSLAAFFGALGEDSYHLSTIAIIVKLDSLQDGDTEDLVDTSIRNARQWLSLGCSEKAGAVFAHSEKHLSSSEVSILTKISWHLAYAEYLLAIDNLDKCRTSLEAAQTLRKELSPKEISRDQRAAFERAHGEGWLLQSKYDLASGAPHDALAAAKHAMKIVNSTWCRLEKGGTDTSSKPEEDTTPNPETSEGAITELATGVSKLQLIPKTTLTHEEAEVPEIKGAAFWPLIPLLCKALRNLSDLYAHHGLFSEANYYSGKAIEMAESMGSSVQLSRTRSHRAVLLVLSGKVEDAELCLVGSESTDLSSSPFAAVERLQAQAAIRAKDGAPDEAAKLYDEAGQLVSDMQTEEWLSKISRFGGDQSGKSVPAKPAQPVPAVKAARPASRTRKAATKTLPAAPKPSARPAKVACVDKTFYMLQKLRAEISLQRTLLPLDSSTDKGEVLLALAPLQSTITGTLKQRRVQYRQLLEKAKMILQTDFAYNILLDSTLSIPALLCPAALKTDTGSASPTKKAVPAKSNTRAGQRKAAAKPDFKSILQEARSCLLAGHSSASQHCTSVEVYGQASNLLDASVFCASVDATATSAGLHSLQTGLTMDFPRINALNLEQSAALADANHELRTTPFEWPTIAAAQHDASQLNATDFQEQYINTIPKPWTAVSLALDESCTSLYVARYRAEQTPFIVRLPFSRHQDEELGDEAFDYAAGKEELQDIIQLSNTSCHNNGDLSAKGAKSNWWREREALDRRLQELLINMEDMWFGGFKGVFSPAARHPELLTRFRAALEASLDRHLPSRQVMKGRGEKLALDHNVLELFVNLGSDCGGTVDLDEAISDLLYFVVDMLQFNGERNAYDEIDFDEITVEVLDALRSYHEAIETDQNGKQHVVLVLDKRLQAFPWENLPCLEQVSVSRVGSMLSLRDCIAAMHNQRDADGCHMVSRKSGAFILNPSSDLASTQSTLQPALSKAAAVEGGNWQCIVNRAPSEEDFKSTLENSALTLYFGHGAGSQYIRPRTIKKLEKCSEVVWLMGCSSGAVTEYGELEPQAVPLAYLNAGMNAGMERASSSSDEKSAQGSKCLAIVATLWDVTDKDIDRFSLTIGEEWGLWSPPAEPVKVPSKTPKKRERLVVAPSTPQKAPKTPKTPRVAKTPAAAKTPARIRSRSTAGDRRVPTSLAGAVARSRDACYLRYLNGAAPVVYGVPVYLEE